MPMICPYCAKDTPKICPSYAQMRHIYAHVTNANFKNITEWLTEWLSNMDSRDASASNKIDNNL